MFSAMYRFTHFIVLLIATCFFISCAGDTTGDSLSSVEKKSDSESQTIINNGELDSTSKDSRAKDTGISADNLKLLEDAHKKNPIDYSAAFNLIQAYETLEMIDEAIDVLEDYINGDDLLIAERARFDRALLFAAYKDKDKAYEVFLDIAENGSEILSSEAYFQLGSMIHIDNYNPPDGNSVELSIEYYKKASRLEPANALLYHRLADLLYAEGKLDEAREYLAIFLVVYPDDYFTWFDLANWSVEADDIERAKEYYRRASESRNEELQDKVKAALRKLD